MTLEICTDQDFDIDEIIDAMDRNEKVEMYNELAGELGKAEYREDSDVSKYFSQMSLFDQKKMLCDALGVPNYYNDLALRQKLEGIITAN